MSLGINSLLSNIDDKMQEFRANPEQAMQRAKITGKTLDAIAAEKVLNDKMDAANELKRQLPGGVSTIVDQNDQELQGIAVQELADGIGKIFQVNQARKQKNLNKIASMGLAGAPVQKRMAMADGGIVGYQAGKDVELETEDEDRSALGIILEDLKRKFSNIPSNISGAIQAFRDSPGMKIGDDTDSGTFTANRPEVGPVGSDKKTLPLDDQRALGQGVMQTYPQGAGIGPETTDEDFQSQLADINRSTATPAIGPNMPNQNIIPPAEEELQEKLENPPEDLNPTDTPKERTRKKNTYNEWFERLLTVLSAPATGRGLGGGNVARAYVQYSQRVLDNFNKALALEIEDEKVKAANKFNQLKAQGVNDAKLMALKEDYINQIRQVREQAKQEIPYLTLQMNKDKLVKLEASDDPDPDEINDLKRAIRTAERLIEAGIAEQTKLQIAEIDEINKILRGSIKGLPSLPTGGSGVPRGFQNKANIVQGP